MAYRRSTVEELAQIRARGSRPEGRLVVVGGRDARIWAEANRFAFVHEADLAEDFAPFAGLFVIFRHRSPNNVRELIHQLTLNASFVTVFNTTTRRTEHLAV